MFPDSGIRPVWVNETYAKMLDTACTLFARKGYFGTSVREIADAMGIQKASLYYYISSKEDLISKNAIEHVSASVNAALAQVSGPEQRLYAFITSHVVGLLTHQNWHAAANDEFMHSFTPARRKEIVAMRDTYEIWRAASWKTHNCQTHTIRHFRQVPQPHPFGMITNLYSWYQPAVDVPPSELGFILADLFMAGILPQDAESIIALEARPSFSRRHKTEKSFPAIAAISD